MRIIYKIKSSWDFISSQILIYLKRRWNSKMAISIKNHEDRITALENKTSSSNAQFVELFSGNTGSQYIPVKEPLSNFDIVFVNFDTGNGFYQQQVISGKYPCNTNGSHYMLIHVPGSRMTYATQASWSTTTLNCPYRQTNIFRIIGLKLYYNFSYNITREFYVVKFNKLRHYLCSHLQNYASNKGGVIQNGY